MNSRNGNKEMIMKKRYGCIVCIVLFISCSPRSFNPPYRDAFKGVPLEIQEQYARLGNSIRLLSVDSMQVDKVREMLEAGYDPNVCAIEGGWSSYNPLNLVATSFYTTYYREIRGEEIPDPPPDVAVLRLLVDAGADINRRPYIWCRVFEYNKWLIEHELVQIGQKMEYDHITTKEEAEAVARSDVKDANRVIAAFLEAGADPDKLGHPYPYSYQGKWVTDEEAEAYFSKGTRAINEAIKKGIWWESQVDLLLRYTTLDKDSLKAAKESKDPAMIAKIEKLWNEQQKR